MDSESSSGEDISHLLRTTPTPTPPAPESPPESPLSASVIPPQPPAFQDFVKEEEVVKAEEEDEDVDAPAPQLEPRSILARAKALALELATQSAEVREVVLRKMREIADASNEISDERLRKLAGEDEDGENVPTDGGEKKESSDDEKPLARLKTPKRKKVVSRATAGRQSPPARPSKRSRSASTTEEEEWTLSKRRVARHCKEGTFDQYKSIRAGKARRRLADLSDDSNSAEETVEETTVKKEDDDGDNDEEWETDPGEGPSTQPDFAPRLRRKKRKRIPKIFSEESESAEERDDPAQERPSSEEEGGQNRKRLKNERLRQEMSVITQGFLRKNLPEDKVQRVKHEYRSRKKQGGDGADSTDVDSSDDDDIKDIYERLVNRLRPMSSQPNLTDVEVLQEWVIYATGQDEDCKETCQCGKQNIRYLNFIWNKNIPDIEQRTLYHKAQVGSVCVQHWYKTLSSPIKIFDHLARLGAGAYFEGWQTPGHNGFHLMTFILDSRPMSRYLRASWNKLHRDYPAAVPFTCSSQPQQRLPARRGRKRKKVKRLYRVTVEATAAERAEYEPRLSSNVKYRIFLGTKERRADDDPVRLRMRRLEDFAEAARRREERRRSHGSTRRKRRRKQTAKDFTK